MRSKSDGGGEVIKLHKLRTRIVFARALTHASGERPGQAAGAVGGHRDNRTQHGGRTARLGGSPVVDHLLDRSELTRERKIEIWTQRRILGERQRIVGPRAVHHRGGHQNEMMHTRFLGKRDELGGTLGHAFTATRTSVVIAGRQVHSDVDWSSGVGLGRGLKRGALGRRRHHIEPTLCGESLRNPGAKTALGSRHQDARHAATITDRSPVASSI